MKNDAKDSNDYYSFAKKSGARLSWNSFMYAPDPFGKDTSEASDYIGDLFVKALEAKRKFKKLNRDTEEEAPYVFRALDNARKDIVRKRWQRYHHPYQVSSVEHDCMIEQDDSPFSSYFSYGIEGQLEARETLRRLKQCFDKSDWELLERVALSGNSDYDPQIDRDNRINHKVKISKLRKKARKFATISHKIVKYS